MEISNKTLTWLVVAAIAVSLIATGVTLTTLNNIKGFTGLAAGDTSNVSGNASVFVSSQTTLRYTTATLDFNALSVNVTTNYCNITHNGTGATAIQFAGCDGYTVASPIPLTLENAGSTDMNVTLNFSANAAALLGGGSKYGVPPVFQFVVNQNEPTSCGAGLSPTSWTNVTANTKILVCSNLSYNDVTGDSINIGLKLGIPVDGTQGSRSVTIWAQGTALS